MLLMMKWQRTVVEPADIICAAQTIRVPSHATRYEIDAISAFTSSDVYLTWAKECLAHGTAMHYDAALSYAKRAVCREIDAFMVCNHLQRFLGVKYPAKIEMLAAVGIDIPSIVYDLIIDPRNNVEHAYAQPTASQARHAIDVASLFLQATAVERDYRATIALGWSIITPVTMILENMQFALDPDGDPMLFADICAMKPRAMILHARTTEILECLMQAFSEKDTITFAKLLRRQYAAGLAGGDRSYYRASCAWLQKLKDQLGL
jgi:hypothetical protein